MVNGWGGRESIQPSLSIKLLGFVKYETSWVERFFSHATLPLLFAPGPSQFTSTYVIWFLIFNSKYRQHDNIYTYTCLQIHFYKISMSIHLHLFWICPRIPALRNNNISHLSIVKDNSRVASVSSSEECLTSSNNGTSIEYKPACVLLCLPSLRCYDTRNQSSVLRWCYSQYLYLTTLYTQSCNLVFTLTYFPNFEKNIYTRDIDGVSKSFCIFFFFWTTANLPRFLRVRPKD